LYFLGEIGPLISKRKSELKKHLYKTVCNYMSSIRKQLTTMMLQIDSIDRGESKLAPLKQNERARLQRAVEDHVELR